MAKRRGQGRAARERGGEGRWCPASPRRYRRSGGFPLVRARGDAHPGSALVGSGRTDLRAGALLDTCPSLEGIVFLGSGLIPARCRDRRDIVTRCTARSRSTSTMTNVGTNLRKIEKWERSHDAALGISRCASSGRQARRDGAGAWIARPRRPCAQVPSAQAEHASSGGHRRKIFAKLRQRLAQTVSADFFTSTAW